MNIPLDAKILSTMKRRTAKIGGVADAVTELINFGHQQLKNAVLRKRIRDLDRDVHDILSCYRGALIEVSYRNCGYSEHSQSVLHVVRVAGFGSSPFSAMFSKRNHATIRNAPKGKPMVSEKSLCGFNNLSFSTFYIWKTKHSSEIFTYDSIKNRRSL